MCSVRSRRTPRSERGRPSRGAARRRAARPSRRGAAEAGRPNCCEDQCGWSVRVHGLATSASASPARTATPASKSPKIAAKATPPIHLRRASPGALASRVTACSSRSVSTTREDAVALDLIPGALEGDPLPVRTPGRLERLVGRTQLSATRVRIHLRLSSPPTQPRRCQIATGCGEARHRGGVQVGDHRSEVGADKVVEAPFGVEGRGRVGDNELEVEDVGACGSQDLAQLGLDRTAPKMPVLAPMTAAGLPRSALAGKGRDAQSTAFFSWPGIDALYWAWRAAGRRRP